MNCIIIEDEVPAQKILTGYLDKVPDINLIGTYNSALKVNSNHKEGAIDIIFLDINLPTISGMDYLKTLSEPPFVIMTTAYSNFAANSFEYSFIIDYLVKPFSFERFLKSINRINSHHNKTPKIQYQSIKKVVEDEESIFISVDKTLHNVKLSDIIYVQSDRNYVTVVTKNVSLVFIDTLKNWIDYLKQDNFLQIHKSFIVNIDYIDKLTGNLVYINSQKVPIGKTYRKSLFKFINPINRLK
jgi:DNA-binding LytR/AlgR family response regulator